MNPLVPKKFLSKGVHGDAESWQPHEWKRTFWDIVSDGKKEDEDQEGDNEKSWAEIDWSAAKEVAMRAIALEKTTVDPTEAELEAAENRQQLHWNEFYKCNKANFFKDRSYLGREFPLLDPAKAESQPFQWSSCMEIGCGVGNTLIPLLRAFPHKKFFASDFAPSAIELLKGHPDVKPAQCFAYVCDIAKESAARPEVPAESVDVVLLIFVLSAISPDLVPAVLLRVKEMLRPGGLLLVRDYGLYDMTQVRFISKKGRKLADNYYARADGTRTFFFAMEHMAQLAQAAGLEVLLNKYDTRELRNRKRQISMYRVFVQGMYRKVGGAPWPPGAMAPQPLSATPAKPAAAATRVPAAAEPEAKKERKDE